MMHVNDIKTSTDFCKYISERTNFVKLQKEELKAGDLAFIPSPLSSNNKKPTLAICLENYHIGMNKFMVCMPLNENKNMTIFNTSCGFEHIFCSYDDCKKYLIYASDKCVTCLYKSQHCVGAKSLNYCSKLYNQIKIPLLSTTTVCNYYVPKVTGTINFFDDKNVKTTLKGYLLFDKGIVKVESIPFEFMKYPHKGIKGNEIAVSKITTINIKSKRPTFIGEINGEFKTAEAIMSYVKSKI